MPFPTYDTIDAVPEAQRDVYEEREGKWHPKIPDVTKATSALDKERGRADEEEKTRKRLEKELAEVRRKQTAGEKGITDEQLEALRKEDADKRKPIEEEMEKLKVENRKIKLTDRLRALAAKLGVMPDRLDDAMTLLETRADLTESGNDIVVKDKDGKTTTEKIEDFLGTTFKTEKPWLYSSPGGSGSGAEGTTLPAGGATTGYDPVAAGKAAAKEQKKAQGESSLAFR